MRASRIQLTRRYQHKQKPASASRYRADPLDSDFLVNLCLSSCRQPVWRTRYRGFHFQPVATKIVLYSKMEHESLVRRSSMHIPTLHLKFWVNSMHFKDFLTCWLDLASNVHHVTKKYIVLQLKAAVIIALSMTVVLQEFLSARMVFRWGDARKKASFSNWNWPTWNSSSR